MTAGPAFIRVAPDEIGRHGGDGAIVLAHIRYRCETNGPGRVVVDGVRWWRASLADIGQELHMSRDVVKRTMKRLGNAVLANHFEPLSDRKLAYHVPPLGGDALTSHRAESPQPEQPQGESATSARPQGESATGVGRNRPDVGAESPSVPLSGELGERGENARADESEPLDAEIVPDSANDPPPQNQPAKQTDPADAWVDAELVDHDPDPEPQPYCDRHMPNGTDNSCGACGRRRRNHENWAQRQQALVLRGIFSKATEPARPTSPPQPKPEPPAWIPGPDGMPRCRRHGHLPTAPANCTGCQDAAVAAKESA